MINKIEFMLFNKFVSFFQKINIEITEKNYFLYKTSLVHNSYSNEHNLNYNYQRLEFLGDAILSKEISLYLYQNFQKQDEGFITHLRSICVQKDTLADASKKLGLQKILCVGKGEKNNFTTRTILADIFESVIAAIYLDKGEQKVREFIYKYLIKFVEEKKFFYTVIDYKTALQEYCQSQKKGLISYRLIDEYHLKNNVTLFCVGVYINDQLIGKGKGSSKKKAEKKAAQSAWELISKKSIKKNNKKYNKNNEKK